MNDPLAFFITFTCYGAWLHGDERGSVDGFHNVPGTPFLPPDPERRQHEAEACEVYLLDQSRRAIALEATKAIAVRKLWQLWAVHIRSNHVHVVVSAPGPVERVMNDIKAAISRRLNKAYPDEENSKRWTRHGSTRYLWNADQLAAATHYVIEGQGDPMEVFDGRTEPRTQRAE